MVGIEGPKIIDIQYIYRKSLKEMSGYKVILAYFF